MLENMYLSPQYNNMVHHSNIIFVVVFHDRQEISLLTVINDYYWTQFISYSASTQTSNYTLLTFKAVYLDYVNQSEFLWKKLCVHCFGNRFYFYGEYLHRQHKML